MNEFWMNFEMYHTQTQTHAHAAVSCVWLVMIQKKIIVVVIYNVDRIYSLTSTGWHSSNVADQVLVTVIWVTVVVIDPHHHQKRWHICCANWQPKRQ